MLKSLAVQNYALIDNLELKFSGGLNIITGETGAGKSVLMGALGMLLGDRADSTALLDKSTKCIISGTFSASDRVKRFLIDEELDVDDELIVHREITKEGKSRAFINDTPVNLAQLRELGSIIVDIHSQHETLLLNRADFQLSVIDSFAKNEKSLSSYETAFREYQSISKELKELIESESRLRIDQDYLQFQFNELDEVALVPGEQSQLETELESLSHAEEIRENTGKFSEIVSGSEENLLARLSSASAILSGIEKYLPSLSDPVKRLKAAYIELKDIEYEVQHLTDGVGTDPQRLDFINGRLDQIYRLQKKHRLETVEALIQLRASIELKLTSFSSLEEKIKQTQARKTESFSKTIKLADELTARRTKAIPSIETKIKGLLSELAMPDATLKVEMNALPDEEINSSGRDRVRFLFSANKGIPYSDISKVASGGELSRLMLALKTSVARLIELPTIVFDEIDTGVSGETAFKIGKVMQELSSAHQLLAITHLPQIASRGETHFFVYKDTDRKKTYTRVKRLTTDERVVEVARMLSGDKPTSVAMENARELLSN